MLGPRLARAIVRAKVARTIVRATVMVKARPMARARARNITLHVWLLS